MELCGGLPTNRCISKHVFAPPPDSFWGSLRARFPPAASKQKYQLVDWIFVKAFLKFAFSIVRTSPLRKHPVPKRTVRKFHGAEIPGAETWCSRDFRLCLWLRSFPFKTAVWANSSMCVLIWQSPGWWYRNICWRSRASRVSGRERGTFTSSTTCWRATLLEAKARTTGRMSIMRFE